MLDLAAPGQLNLYYAGIERLVSLFPRDFSTIAVYDEEMRAEIWPRLHQEIVEGTKPAPRNFNPKKPWGTLIAESRFDYLQGPLADHWRRREVQLERGVRTKPEGKSTGEAPLGSAVEPTLPSFQSQHQQQASSGWGSGGANPEGLSKRAAKRQRAESAAAKPKAKPAPQPKQLYLVPRGAKGKGKNANGMPEGYTGCHHCGSKKHFLAHCPQWIAAGRPPFDSAKRQKGTK